MADNQSQIEGPGNMSQKGQYVLTPSGYRHRSLIHRLPTEACVRCRDQHWKATSHAGEELIDVPANPQLVAPKELAQAVGGWASYAAWTNDTGTPISSFETTWTVPPEPLTKSGQQIYLFNGLQSVAHDHVLQPVLQWGTRTNLVGTGSFWTVASWWVPPNNGSPVMVRGPVPVKVGQTLTGRMSTKSGQHGQFEYTCEFADLPATALSVEFEELPNCVETLEAYGIAGETDYPATARTSFTNINVAVGGGPAAALVWMPAGTFSPEVINNSPTNGRVDIVYPASGV